MNKLFEVENGNCTVILYENGTRVVETIDPRDDHIDLKQPLSLDINISNRCSNGCPYCYAGNTPQGRVADLKDMTYLDGVSGIEIAINIQYPLPDNFEWWLEKMKSQNIVVSGTISQTDLERDRSIVSYLKSLQERGLLRGIGISYRDYDSVLEDLIASTLSNVVIHTIVGITSPATIMRLLGREFKVLILGYKQNARGKDYFRNVDIEQWKKSIDDIMRFKHGSVLAFDTCAINQLDLKSKLPEDKWNAFFQGEEGTISFYIDAVKRTFNTDSHTLDEPYSIDDIIKKKGKDSDIEKMFKVIKDKVGSREE